MNPGGLPAGPRGAFAPVIFSPCCSTIAARFLYKEGGNDSDQREELESGASFAVNGGVSFPMASTVKLPILVEVMARIKDGEFNLTDEWSVEPPDQFYDGSLLSDLKAPGINLSVENLINLMMWQSDNTATDLLLKKVGIAAVNTRMRFIGIENILVSRTIRELLLDYYVGESEKYARMTRDDFGRI